MKPDWRHVAAVQKPDGLEIVTWMTHFRFTEQDKKALGLTGESFTGLTPEQAETQGNKAEAAIAKTRRKK